MAWEARGNRSYLYRKTRTGGSVKSEYLGAGKTAALIDRIESREREQKRVEREKERDRRLEIESLDEQLDELSEINQSLVDALFLINGFHQHKRQWRKKRR